MTEQKHADDAGRDIHRAQGDEFLPEERTCLTITIYLHLNESTYEAFRNGTQQLMIEIEESVRKNLPTRALGHPPVVICFSQMPE